MTVLIGNSRNRAIAPTEPDLSDVPGEFRRKFTKEHHDRVRREIASRLACEFPTWSGFDLDGVALYYDPAPYKSRMPENAVQAIQVEKSFPNSHSVAVTAGTLDRTETVFHNHGISGVPIFARNGVDRWVPHPMDPEGGFIYQAGPDLPREFTNRVIHQVVNGLRVRNLNAELLIDNDGQPIGIGIDSGSANPARLELPHPGPLITIRHSDRDDVNEALKKTMWDMRDELERMRLSFKPNDTHCEVLPSKGRVVGG